MCTHTHRHPPHTPHKGSGEQTQNCDQTTSEATSDLRGWQMCPYFLFNKLLHRLNFMLWKSLVIIAKLSNKLHLQLWRGLQDSVCPRDSVWEVQSLIEKYCKLIASSNPKMIAARGQWIPCYWNSWVSFISRCIFHTEYEQLTLCKMLWFLSLKKCFSV